MRLPDSSTMGNLPFFDFERTSLARRRSVPSLAVTRSVDMTSVTGSNGSEWNWMSRDVIMPIRRERKRPVSRTYG